MHSLEVIMAMNQPGFKPTHTPAIISNPAQDLQDSLGNLLQWAIGNRGRKDINPYAVPEVKAAFQTLAKVQGWNEPGSWYDAADSYKTGEADGRERSSSYRSETFTR